MARKPDPDASSKLLAAARRAFADVGVDHARVEDISRAAGLSKRAFYLHFREKHAVFEDLCSQFFGVMTDLVAQRHEACQELVARAGALTAVDWRSHSPRRVTYEQFEHEHTVRSLQGLWRHRDVLRAILDHGGLRGRIVEQFVELARATVAVQFETAMDAGALRTDLDRELVSDLVIGMWLQLGRRMVRASARPDFDRWARTVDALTAEGLAVRTPAGLVTTDSAVNNHAHERAS